MPRSEFHRKGGKRPFTNKNQITGPKSINYRCILTPGWQAA